ncbi:MAG: KpsF/GutQ family sugar-phosphate isomerase [Candidatus Cloacimonas sp.]|nr:KpsF/GutQ family sugar-phosphate isomerase [Candidatus Cloacimonadota bacterium]
MSEIIKLVQDELKLAAESITLAAAKVNSNVEEAVELILSCEGKVVVTGMGKTGLIGRKISATLASTGTTSIFLHAAEGIHGDLGMLDKRDVVLAISYSGNTQELLSIIPYIKFLKIPIIAITGNLSSQLSENADVILDCSVPDGYEPFNLVPTVSTTVALALADAIAVALIKKRSFNVEDFARFHPGGTIGKKLLLTVDDLMHTGEFNPIVGKDSKLKEVILTMTQKGLGCTNVIDDKNNLCGIVTDGDLRRLLSRDDDLFNLTAQDFMTPNPKTIKADMLAVAALNLMEENKITMLPVVNDQNSPIGLLHMHDLINAGVVG